MALFRSISFAERRMIVKKGAREMGVGDSIPRGGDDLVVSLGQDDEAFWRDIADRGVDALEALEPGGPNFWTVVQALAPWAAFLAAAVVAVVALLNLAHQRKVLASSNANESRSEWWRRTQWALEASTSRDPSMKKFGKEVLEQLVDSPLTSDSDKILLDAVWKGGNTGLVESKIQLLLQDANRFGFLGGGDPASEETVDQKSTERDNGDQE